MPIGRAALSERNENYMNVTFLGTGTGVPSVKRASPGLLIKENQTTVMIDSGPGALRQLAAAGVSFEDLDGVFYTHFHPDHIADLPAFLFALRYFSIGTRTEPVRVVGAKGLADLVAGLTGAYGEWIEPGSAKAIISELPTGDWTHFSCRGVEAVSGPIPHLPHSLGYRFKTAAGKVLAITGDTGFGPGLIEFATGADVLITECSFYERQVSGHLTAREVALAARQSGVSTLVLTHLYPGTDSREVAAAVSSDFPGRVLVAEDLMEMVW